MVSFKVLFGLLSVAIGIANIAAKDHHDREDKAKDVKFYELKRGNLRVKFTNFGARIVSLNVPDKFGKSADILLGYDTVEEYKRDNNSFGAIVGRVANRIGGAKFNLGNHRYNLTSNDGVNTLNGGRQGFGNVAWTVTKLEKSKKNPFITFHYNSFDNEQGFPGNLNVTATYTLQSKNKLKLSIEAEAQDKPTPVNLAQYTFWNLDCRNSSKNVLRDYQLQVPASKLVELDQNLVPTGRILPVNDTPYDFLKSHKIGSRFSKIRDGYEVDFVLDEQKKNLKLAAVLKDNRTGRILKLWTDQSVLQFSTANDLKNVKGKGGFVYRRNSGVVLAAQGYPNAVNIKNFPSQILEKGKTYKQTTVFEFGIQGKTILN